MQDLDRREEAEPRCEDGYERWARAAAAGLAFRPIAEADLPFLANLYASTRTEELAVVDWPDEQKAAFLRQQFAAQHAHYTQHYPRAAFLIVLQNSAPIGRLYVAHWAREHRIVDIAFLPEHRRQGLGAALMRDLMDEAAAAGKALSIHVEKFNPAYRLYLRLGFVKVGDEGAYDLMTWEAS
jgi:ribosomal protein S18 acetylase RimI-like enzyme